jgi:hypothetical protein
MTLKRDRLILCQRKPTFDVFAGLIRRNADSSDAPAPRAD